MNFLLQTCLLLGPSSALRALPALTDLPALRGKLLHHLREIWLLLTKLIAGTPHAAHTLFCPPSPPPLPFRTYPVLLYGGVFLFHCLCSTIEASTSRDLFLRPTYFALGNASRTTCIAASSDGFYSVVPHAVLLDILAPVFTLALHTRLCIIQWGFR